MISAQYLTEIKAKLLAGPAVITVAVKERTLPESGYFRARLTLRNGDFLEVVEFFTDNRWSAESYRYQWMDQTPANFTEAVG